MTTPDERRARWREAKRTRARQTRQRCTDDLRFCNALRDWLGLRPLYQPHQSETRRRGGL